MGAGFKLMTMSVCLSVCLLPVASECMSGRAVCSVKEARGHQFSVGGPSAVSKLTVVG